MNEAPASKWKSNLLYLVMSLIFTAAALILAGGFVLNRLFGTWSEPADVATVNRWVRVGLPASARLRNSLAIHHGIDFELYAQVEIDRSDVDAFVDALKTDSSTTLSRSDRMQLTNSIRNWRKDTPVPDWWDPDSARELIACDLVPHLLLISLDDPANSTIWIHVDTDGPPSKKRKAPL